ncbi:hypothetical protein PUN4_530008 [Paraburkholderia unamae]|nr:hypothetical protein PUN4_530008 [Paraburkholderia unamae]
MGDGTDRGRPGGKAAGRVKLDGMVQARKKDGVRKTPGRALRIMQQRLTFRRLSECFTRRTVVAARKRPKGRIGQV